MSRLSDHAYIENYRLLRADHEGDRAAFVLLSAGEQWDLFQYYLPHKAHKRTALLAHRREVTDLDPSLPQRAGRAFSRWRRIRESLPGYREYAASRPRMKKNAEKRIVVYSKVTPEPDAARLARIIVDAARERASSLSTMRVTEVDATFTESGLDGTGAEAEPFTDTRKG